MLTLTMTVLKFVVFLIHMNWLNWKKNRLSGIDKDLGFGPDYYQIEEFDLIVENNMSC